MGEDKARKQRAKVGTAVAMTALVVCAGWMAHLRVSNNSGTPVSEESDSQRRTAQGFAGLIFINEGKTWDQANQHCRSLGALLATADTEAKSNRIREVGGDRSVWIGYRSQGGNPADKSGYRWQSGAPNGWTKWAAGEPNNPASLPQEYCTEQRGNKEWNNLRCSDDRWKLPFVCDKSAYVDSYAMHGLNGAGVSYDEANSICREYYGTGLATLAEPATMSYVMQQAQADRAWVGLRVTPGSGHNVNNFQNMNGQPRAALSWLPGQPDNWKGNEACAEVRSGGKLNDLDCAAKLPKFLCDQFVGNEDWSVSTFELMSSRNPAKNWRIPSKVIEYNGRTKYSLFFDLRINGLNAGWTNIVHVGNSNGMRLPGIWLFKEKYRRLHFRQKSTTNNNNGCDPSECDTPKLGQFFTVAVLAESGNKFTVKYDGVVRCTATFQVVGDAAAMPVYVSNPWYGASPVTYKNMRFALA